MNKEITVYDIAIAGFNYTGKERGGIAAGYLVTRLQGPGDLVTKQHIYTDSQLIISESLQRRGEPPKEILVAFVTKNK